MIATNPTIAMTISVVCVVSLRVGQTTLRTSVCDSRTNSHAARPFPVCKATNSATAVSTSRPMTRSSSDSSDQ